MLDALPVNLDAERAVLGAIFSRPEQFPMFAAALQAGDFSLEKHRRIFAAMADVHEAGSVPERTSVALRLRDLKQMENDTLSFLSSLDDGLSSVFDATPYVQTVQQYAVRRRTIYALRASAIKLTNTSEPLESTLAETQLALRDSEAATNTRSSGLAGVLDIVAGAGGLNGFLSPQIDPRAVAYPWQGLTLRTAGMMPGELVLVAARTSVGKTACANQIALNAALHGVSTAMFSLEMSSEEVLRRMACTHATVNSFTLRRGQVRSDDRSRLNASMSALSECRLFICDSGKATVSAVEAELRKLQSRHGLGLVIIDYLQLMQSLGRHDTRAGEVASISRGLKLAAKEFEVPFVVLSQLSRAADENGRRPRLTDLRESGALEQDADTVLFIHRKDIMQPECDFIIGKHRHAGLSEMSMWYRGEYTRFEEQVQESAYAG